MLDKLRRNSKQLLEQKPKSKRDSVSTQTSAPTPSPWWTPRRLTFFDLPAEIRNAIYEDVARDTSISLPLTSNKNGKKATALGKITMGPIPSLVIVSRQTKREYLPLLLQLARVRVIIQDFDFRNLIRMLSSLYNTDLKTLRTNNRLTIQLLAEKGSRDSIVGLRRWLDNRANGLDRLPWGYSIYWKPKHQIAETTSDHQKAHIHLARRKVLEQNLEGIAQLHKNVHENLQFELQPIIAAFETELARTPDPLDMSAFMTFGSSRTPSGTMCSI